MGMKFLFGLMKIFSDCGGDHIIVNIQKSLNIYFKIVHFMLCLLYVYYYAMKLVLKKTKMKCQKIWI